MTSLIPRGDATFSPCGGYRYRLERPLDGASGRSRRTATFIMLNPSTADAEQDDPTIRRCIRFARREQCGRLIVVNIFAIRATDPRVMLAHPEPIGADNNTAIWQAASDAHKSDGPIVCAWGTHGKHRDRDAHVLTILASILARPVCLGETAEGFPRHPLYVPGSTPLAPYRGRP
jgi:hypothetical protein